MRLRASILSSFLGLAALAAVSSASLTARADILPDPEDAGPVQSADAGSGTTDGGAVATSSSSGGCSLGGADVGASALLLGLVLPALARRRRRKQA
jgi:hypothetical protein